MTDREKMFLLRSTLKATLHRLETDDKWIRDIAARRRLVTQCYAVLRKTESHYDSVSISSGPNPRG